MNLTIRGQTKAAKESLKAHDWKYDGRAKVWRMTISEEVYRQLLILAPADARKLGARHRGCLTLITDDHGNSRTLYRSPSFSEIGNTGPSKGGIKGLDYCDQFGNYVGGEHIPGSAPDDLI